MTLIIKDVSQLMWFNQNYSNIFIVSIKVQ